MFDVFPLTQNEVPPVTFYATINLVTTSLFLKNKYLLESLIQSCFFRLDQQDQAEIGKVI